MDIRAAKDRIFFEWFIIKADAIVVSAGRSWYRSAVPNTERSDEPDPVVLCGYPAASYPASGFVSAVINSLIEAKRKFIRGESARIIA